MMNSELRKVLKAEYEARKRKNPLYSMRAFSRDLGLTIATLSEFLSGKRELSKRSLTLIGGAIGLPIPNQGAMAARSRSPLHRELSGTEYEKLISGWLPYALLNVPAIRNHSSSPVWLAKHFGVKVAEVKDCLKSLQEMGLIRIEGQKIVRVAVNLTTSNDVPSGKIRNYHRQSLKKAESVLDGVDVSLREFTSTVFPISKSDLLEIKNYIRKFRRQIGQRFAGKNADAVYNLSLQFFPLSADMAELMEEQL